MSRGVGNFDNFEKGESDPKTELYFPAVAARGATRDTRQLGLFGRNLDRGDTGQHREGRVHGHQGTAKLSDSQSDAETVERDVELRRDDATKEGGGSLSVRREGLKF